MVRSVWLPIELDQAVATTAKDAAVPKSTWIRQSPLAAEYRYLSERYA